MVRKWKAPYFSLLFPIGPNMLLFEQLSLYFPDFVPNWPLGKDKTSRYAHHNILTNFACLLCSWLLNFIVSFILFHSWKLQLTKSLTIRYLYSIKDTEQSTRSEIDISCDICITVCHIWWHLIQIMKLYYFNNS